MPATIFSGTEVKALKSNLNLNDDYKILTGTDDPTSVAKSAPIGSIYVKTDTGQTYKKLDAGSSTNWTLTTSVGGSGINYETDPFIKAGQGTWTTYDDGASADMVDGTGGSPSGLTITASATDTQIFSGDYAGNIKIAKAAADHQGEGLAKVYTIPNASQDAGQVYISGYYSTSTAFATGDIGIYVYDVTNAALLNVYGLTDNELVGVAANTVGRFTVRVPIEATTASIRVGFHWKTASTSALDIYFSGLKVGPDALVDTPIEHYMGQLTTTGSITSNVTYTVKYWRKGSHLVARGRMDFTGAASPTATAITVTLPNSLNILSSSRIANSPFGLVEFDISSTPYSGFVSYSSATAVLLQYSNVSGTVIRESSSDDNEPATIGNGDRINFWYEVPIAEWDGQSGVISTTEAMNKTASARAYLGSAQNHTNSGGWEKINIDTADHDSLGLLNTGSYYFVVKESGKYRFNGAIAFNAISDGALVGARVVKNNSTVLAYTLMTTGASSNSSPQVDSGVVELAAGDYVQLDGYQNDSASEAVTTGTSATYFSIEKIPDLSVYSVYGKYEVQKDNSAGLITYPITAGQYGDLDSFSLSPGTWELMGNTTYKSNGATTTTHCWIGFSTTSGNSGTGLVIGENFNSINKETTNGSYQSVSIPSYIVEVTSATTYYLKGYAANDITNLQIGWSWVAKRLR